MLLKLDADDFKEINPSAKFDFSCLPISYTNLESAQLSGQQPKFSNEVKQELNRLLNAINTEGTNLEYSYLLTGSSGNNTYTNFEPMIVGSSQAVKYDWKKLKNI